MMTEKNMEFKPTLLLFAIYQNITYIAHLARGRLRVALAVRNH